MDAEKVAGKACTKCGEFKAFDQFRPDCRKAGRRVAICRACDSVARVARYMRSPEAHMKMIEVWRRYRASGRAPRRYGTKDAARYRDKDAVRNKTKVLVKKGEIPRVDECELCGSRKPEIHYRTYETPFDIEWLCRPCHAKTHRLTIADLVDKHAIRSKKDAD